MVGCSVGFGPEGSREIGKERIGVHGVCRRKRYC
jgi:hypothetical protein